MATNGRVACGMVTETDCRYVESPPDRLGSAGFRAPGNQKRDNGGEPGAGCRNGTDVRMLTMMLRWLRSRPDQQVTTHEEVAETSGEASWKPIGRDQETKIRGTERDFLFFAAWSRKWARGRVWLVVASKWVAGLGGLVMSCRAQEPPSTTEIKGNQKATRGAE